MVKRSLNKVEEQIETNVLKAWYDNGLLLREIRDDKLYKKKYGTFEEYADQRWGWKRTHAYRMIDAAERFQAIENGLRTLNLIVRIGWSAPPPCGLLPIKTTSTQPAPPQW